MHSIVQYKAITALSIFILVAACVPAQKVAEEKINLVWPVAPAQPKIAYEFSFNNADDLGIKKGIWARVVELFIGPEDHYMIKPMAITETDNGVLYVADPGVRGVHRFDKSDAEYDIIRLKEGGILPSPVALVSDGQGNVLVSDSEHGKLYKIEDGADYAVEYKLDFDLQQPTGLAFNPDNGYLYIVDTARHEIIVFDYQNEKLIKRFGKHGKGKGEFNFPTMIWSDQLGQILVTDSLNFRIQLFDKQGRYLSRFGELGDATGYHTRPKGVATDQDGHIYVVDSLFHNVQIFNREGAFLLNFGEQGQKPGQFWLPTGIFISHDKRIYVADSFNRRVQVFSYIGATK